ncbi:MAG: CRISPR-associated endonuclease Cas2, partial [Ktedonobacterales bacterium]
MLVAYDVTTETAEGKRRLRKVAEVCVGFGQRVQDSVFECVLTETQFETLRHRLLACIDEREDSLRIYRLAQPRDRHSWIYGVRREIN